jgi:hypothetical protein
VRSDLEPGQWHQIWYQASEIRSGTRLVRSDLGSGYCYSDPIEKYWSEGESSVSASTYTYIYMYFTVNYHPYNSPKLSWYILPFQWSPLVLNPSFTIMHFLGANKISGVDSVCCMASAWFLMCVGVVKCICFQSISGCLQHLRLVILFRFVFLWKCYIF